MPVVPYKQFRSVCAARYLGGVHMQKAEYIQISACTALCNASKHIQAKASPECCTAHRAFQNYKRLFHYHIRQLMEQKRPGRQKADIG